MLYLEHCISLINNSNFQLFSKKYFLHFNSFENIMENGTFAASGANVPFFIIVSKILHFKGVQRRLCGEKGLV